MSRGEENTKRRSWRPRFSLRTLTVVVTLVCAYFAAWEATKKFGVPNVSTRLRGEDTAIDVEVFDAWSTIPLIIGCDAQYSEMGIVEGRRYAVNRWVECNYYLWLFGSMVKLPITAESAHAISGSHGGMMGGMGRGMAPKSP